MENIHAEIKSLLIKHNVNLTDIAKYLGYNQMQNFSQKLRRETLHYKEYKKILEYLGLEQNLAKKAK